MFDLFKKKDNNIYSPVKGTMVPLEEVPDKTFSDKLLGDGAAFYLDEDMVYAPCSGRIIMIADTKHAVGMAADNGAELLIHVGLETVNLNGKGFEMLVSEGMKVKKGSPLIRVDRAFMDASHIELIIPMIITNEKEFELHQTEQVDTESVVMRIAG